MPEECQSYRFMDQLICERCNTIYELDEGEEPQCLQGTDHDHSETEE